MNTLPSDTNPGQTEKRRQEIIQNIKEGMLETEKKELEEVLSDVEIFQIVFGSYDENIINVRATAQDRLKEGMSIQDISEQEEYLIIYLGEYYARVATFRDELKEPHVREEDEEKLEKFLKEDLELIKEKIRNLYIKSLFEDGMDLSQNSLGIKPNGMLFYCDFIEQKYKTLVDKAVDWQAYYHDTITDEEDEKYHIKVISDGLTKLQEILVDPRHKPRLIECILWQYDNSQDPQKFRNNFRKYIDKIRLIFDPQNEYSVKTLSRLLKDLDFSQEETEEIFKIQLKIPLPH